MARRKWDIQTIKQVVNGENPFIQFGYDKAEKPFSSRKEGEVWTDLKGKTWRREGSAKVMVNAQMDCIRELVKQKCSKCNKDIRLVGNKWDRQYFNKSGKCFDCVIEEETLLRINGGWEEHERKRILNSQLSCLRDLKKNLIESIDFMKSDKAKVEAVCANGDVEVWNGAMYKPLLKEAKKDLKKTEKGIKDLEIALSKS